jgi:site-specific recombinase XerD
MIELSGRPNGGVEVITEAEEQGYALVLPGRTPAPHFAAVWGGAYEGAEEGLRRVWDRLRDAWLKTKEAKSGSAHTRRSYEFATAEWLDFLATLRHHDGRTVKAWEATADHVREWQYVLLEERGLSGSSVNQRLAACSSYYSFVIREKGLVDGVEISAFMDRTGKTRENPFSGGNVQRVRTKQYGHARVLTHAETNRLITYLDQHKGTLTGARNYALIITYLMTGYRNHEGVSMKWGAMRPNRKQPGAFVFEWQGKGGKSQNDPLPPRVYHAIVHYLKVSGRFPAEMGAEEYIFVPLVTHNVTNLRNVKEVSGHLSEKSAVRILRTALAKAGVSDPEGVRLHDLRHTFAHRYRQGNGDLEALRERLHHESLATTGIYAREVLDDPVDDYSESLFQNLRFEF